MFRDLLHNKLSDKNDLTEPLCNLIGHIYFTNSSKYRTTNHYLHTKFFACGKKSYRLSRFSQKASWGKRRTTGPCWSYARFSDIASVEEFIIIQTQSCSRVVVSEKFSRAILRDKRQGSSSWFCCHDYIWFSVSNDSVKDFFRTLCQRKDSALLLWSVILKEVILLVILNSVKTHGNKTLVFG